MASRTSVRLEPEEQRDVAEAGRLSARVVFEIIRRDGVEELKRPLTSLIWSGVAAGITISFSIIAMSLFRLYLPDAGWRPLVESFGYSLGFLLTILGRLQLFTENTITTVVPLLRAPTARALGLTLRLWMIVFGANIVGVVVVALFMAYSGAFEPDLLAAVSEISLHVMSFDPWEMFVRAIPAGILVAALVWVLPSAGGAAFLVIVVFTYVISLGGFTHVVAGSTEAAFLVVTGQIGLEQALAGFLAPVFFGNVVGGTLVFGMLAYAQVSREFD